jgi:CMP-N,N'-diacetyllegionaminic acid synthase
MKMKTICIIPAKGASTRLPQKNILILNGKPVLYYTIEAAKKAGIFDDIIVSTEDVQVKSIAEEYGVEVLMRPMVLARNPAGVVDVCLHALECLEKAGRTYDHICILYPSSPLRNADDVKGAYELYKTGKGLSLFSVVEFAHTPLRAVSVDEENGQMHFQFPEYENVKSQQLPQLYHITGSIIILSVEHLRRHRSYFVMPQLAYRLPRERAVDIDTRDDLEYAEYLMRRDIDDSIR